LPRSGRSVDACVYMWRLHAFALALLVAHVSAFSSTPARTDARDPPVPDPPPLRSVPLLGADANFEPDIDSDGDGVLSFREAYEYGRLLPCNNYTEYQVHLLLTWRANDADGDGNYTKGEARGHFLSLPAEVQEEIAGCAWHAGNGRRLSDAEVALASPAFAATVKPAPLPLPIPDPEFNDNYASYESTRLGLDVLFKCFEYERCPPGVTPDDMDDFLSNVLTHFKTQDSIAQLTEQVSNAAVQAIKDEADERNADLRRNTMTASSLNIASGGFGLASAFFKGSPGFGLFLTASSVGTMVGAAALNLKHKDLQEGVIEYLTGFQQKVVNRPEMSTIKEWSEAGTRMGAFFPRLQLMTEMDSMWALYGAIPVGTQAAMTDASLRQYMYDEEERDFYCPDPCTNPYDHLTVKAMKTYITLMAAPMAALDQDRALRRHYMIQLANATVGEYEAVKVDALTDLNTEFFNGQLASYVQLAQGLMGLWVIPVFFKSGYTVVWNWWKGGSRFVGIGRATGIINSNIGFPSAKQLASIDERLVKEVVRDMHSRGGQMVSYKDGVPTDSYLSRRGLKMQTDARQMLNTKPSKWTSQQREFFNEQLHGKNTAGRPVSGTAATKQKIAKLLDNNPQRKAQLAAVAKQNGMSKWARAKAIIGKGLAVLVVLAITVFEVLAIISAQQVYEKYEENIEEVASATKQYYAEIISAYSQDEEESE